ncbi:sensor histidine kinase [Streptomyces sp. SID7499]|uniref:histidine kinase n=1 Tax=Streptomyces sp. SID7499 TaxID=2706086 RepID=A0A6G3WNR8_9ACTN|nr:sensor histidine kinase [Streptomyces sp. SID7499]
MGEPDTGERLAAALRDVPRNLREDLWTADARLRAPRARWLSVLEGIAPVLFGLALLVFNWNRYFYGFQLGALGILIVVGQSVVPLLALRRPIPGWWMATLLQTALVASWFTPRTVSSDLTADWSSSELVLQAWVLFLVALSSRPRAALEALAINIVTGLLFVLVWDYENYAVLTVVTLAIATLVGSALRSRNMAREELVAQKELTAEEQARRTLLEERTRIARELHDVVAHHMSVISIQAQAAPHLAENPSAELTENLESIRQNAKDALSELRQVLGVLRSEHTGPEADPHAPQPSLDRLDELVANVRAAGYGVTLRTTGERGPLPQGVELSAFRIVQEALSNAMRHAPGAEVRVDIAYSPSDVTVRITNTAPTGPVPSSPGTGHGLLGMRERAAILGGTLTCAATADGGYEVSAALPAKPPTAAAERVRNL